MATPTRHQGHPFSLISRGWGPGRYTSAGIPVVNPYLAWTGPGASRSLHGAKSREKKVCRDENPASTPSPSHMLYCPVDTGQQCGDVVGLHIREGAETELVTAQGTVRVDIHDAVLA